jgi:hypothetical protein
MTSIRCRRPWQFAGYVFTRIRQLSRDSSGELGIDGTAMDSRSGRRHLNVRWILRLHATNNFLQHQAQLRLQPTNHTSVALERVMDRSRIP